MLPHPSRQSSKERTRTFGAVLALLLAVGMAGAVQKANADDYTQRQMLTAIASGDGEPNGLFGLSVAIDGDLAVVSNFASTTRPARVRTYARSGATWTYLPGHDIELTGDSDVLMSFNEGTLLIETYQSAPAPSRTYVEIFQHSDSGWESQFGFSTTGAYYDSIATNDYIAVLGESSYDGGSGANQGRVFVLRRISGSWEQDIIEPTTPQAGARFGQSVALVAGAIVVGAPRETVTYANAGAAYVYELTIDTWNEVARLVEPDGADHSDHRFGTAVAINGEDISTPDRLLVSAPSNEATGYAGRVYSYRRESGTWTQRSVVTAPSASDSDGFGCSLALDYIWAVIGMCSSDDAAPDAGAVALARFSTSFGSVVSVTVRTDPLAEESEYLGGRIDVDRNGPTVIVGNPIAQLYGNEAQGAVLFGGVESGGDPFTLTRQLDLGQGLTSATAGTFAIDGDTLLIGAFGEDVGVQQERGAVYEYRRLPDGQYAFQSRILAPDGRAGDYFGLRMALKGDTVLISSIGYVLGGVEHAGAVYAFHRQSGVWSLEAEFLPVAPMYETEFGEGLAFDGSTAFIGNRRDSTFVYERSTSGIWTPVQTIAHVGWPVRLSGDVAAISNFFANDDIGEVALYQRVGDTWQPQATVAGTEVSQGFGYGLDLAGDLLAVASSNAASPVQLFRHGANGWLPEASVLPDDATQTTYCWNATVSAASLAIGCSEPGTVGAVYVFEKIGGSWTQQQKIVLDEAAAGDGFGFDLGFHDGGMLAIAAPWRDVDFINQGAVYLYAGDVLFRDGFD